MARRLSSRVVRRLAVALTRLDERLNPPPSPEPTPLVPGPVFKYRDWEIPENLVRMTGGGPETWEPISQLHLDEYARYCPIQPEHSVMEVGCGVGRDAIQLSGILSSKGKYFGLDIIRPSIEWCQQNITARYPNFRFEFVNVLSPIHNPGGTLRVQDVRFNVPDGSVDRILLQSVFTHMFKPDIVHYLREFRRVLKPEGKVFASMFILDEETVELARKSGSPLRFENLYQPGCWINDTTYPEGSVGFDRQTLQAMLTEARMQLAEPLHLGCWNGRTSVDAQDVAILTRL